MSHWLAYLQAKECVFPKISNSEKRVVITTRSGDFLDDTSGIGYPDETISRVACSRRSDSRARAKKKASERAGKTRGDWGRGRENACEINFKKLVTVYQNLVYPLIGQI